MEGLLLLYEGIITHNSNLLFNNQQTNPISCTINNKLPNNLNCIFIFRLSPLLYLP